VRSHIELVHLQALSEISGPSSRSVRWFQFVYFSEESFIVQAPHRGRLLQILKRFQKFTLDAYFCHLSRSNEGTSRLVMNDRGKWIQRQRRTGASSVKSFFFDRQIASVLVAYASQCGGKI
jgi:hypothetical protein